MGKQRSKVLETKAEHLYEMFPEKFGTDFTQNKKSIDELKLPFTKIDRNLIAGCVTKLALRAKKKKV